MGGFIDVELTAGGSSRGYLAETAEAELYRYDAKHGLMNKQLPTVHGVAAARIASARGFAFRRRH